MAIRPLPVGNQSNKPNVFGDALTEFLKTRKTKANENYAQNRTDRTSEVAVDVVDKSAGNVHRNQFGIPTKKPLDLGGQFGSQLDTLSRTGQSATLAAVERAKHQEIERLKSLSQFSVDFKFSNLSSIVPGASANNPGAKAVALALQAYQNKTPYVWGGNSLTRGVDCSGLVQQVYGQLGIKLPRTTYEQAKNGKQVPLSSLLPGDLVFYNTGARDPNGIGRNSHVAIYIGNGQVVHAVNSREGIKTTNITHSGAPSMGLRPW
jgi:cell wall-associated NlpC family hydrolase